MISRAARGPPPAGMLTSTSATSGRLACGELDGLIRVAGLAHEDQALLVGQQIGERSPQGRLVVGDQDADRRRGSDRAAGGSSDGNHGEDRTGRGEGVQSPGEARAETPDAFGRIPRPAYYRCAAARPAAEVDDERTRDPRAPRHGAVMPVVAAGGRDADADEQPRSRRGRASRGSGRLRRDRTGRPLVGGVRRHRADAQDAPRRRDAPGAVGQAGRACSARTRWRRGC